MPTLLKDLRHRFGWVLALYGIICCGALQKMVVAEDGRPVSRIYCVVWASLQDRGGSVVCGLAGAVSRALQSTYLFAVPQLVMFVDVVAQRFHSHIDLCDFLRKVRVVRCSGLLSCVCSAVPCRA
jgi:hypothetical protein